MRIFLDTNVLVSAFTARGLCAELLEKIITEHHLIVGEFILKELERVLLTKLSIPSAKVSATINFLQKYEIVPIPKMPSGISIRDSDDLWVLQSAIEAESDYLVTGDKDLLDTAEIVEDLKIVSPRELWLVLEAKKS